jgi:hypothetical protein
MMMRTVSALVTAAVVLAPEVQAANLAVIKSPPTMLNVLVFLGALICAVGSYRVVGLVRGGLLSRSWQFLLGGFAALALSQLLSLLGSFELLALPPFAVPALLVVMAGLIAYGIFEVVRTLG